MHITPRPVLSLAPYRLTAMALEWTQCEQGGFIDLCRDSLGRSGACHWTYTDDKHSWGEESEPVWPGGKAGKQKELGSNPLRLSFLFKSCGLRTLSSLTINEILICLSSLPVLMMESFWWWKSLFPHLYVPFLHLLPVPNKPYGFCGR